MLHPAMGELEQVGIAPSDAQLPIHKFERVFFCRHDYGKVQMIEFFHQRSWAHVIGGVLRDTFKSLCLISSSKLHFALL